MTYAVLLWPHANVRYFESMKTLAEGELTVMLSAVQENIEIKKTNMNGLELMTFEGPEFDERMKKLLSMVSCAYAVFAVEGEMLRPLMQGGQLRFGGDLSGILKYKGKTNEMFTGMLINLAVFCSDFAAKFDKNLAILDPMCGRGTSLFEGLRRNYDMTGVEIDKNDVGELTRFVKKYAEYNRLKHKVESASMTVDGKNAGAKTKITLAENNAMWKEDPRVVTVTLGDTLLTDKFYKGRNFHALVCDLPYGVQHESRDGKSKVSLDKMMEKALLSWKKTLIPGACVALSFNANTLPLADARMMLAKAGYEPLVGGVYDNFGHWVEQAITRDIVLAKYTGK